MRKIRTMTRKGYDRECYRLYHDPRYTATKQKDPNIRAKYVAKAIALKTTYKSHTDKP